ncbi:MULTISPECIES: molybdate ABC transporter permease subunit [Paenibacillus]|uniref:molybdate ABC transporter permease subunit n=1 Tax=Paenibacillus TaxID=44249 RepID=UPI00048C39AA|nr:molybdate ABC transporter permease subunit [Paenibacillus sp. IHBB 10380]
MTEAEMFWMPVWLSIKTSLLSSMITFILGTAAARWMSRRRFAGKTAVETLLMLPLVLPPTVVGFLLLVILGRNSWVGAAAEWLFARPVVFSWGAAVIAAIVVSFPLVYQSMRVGFESVDAELEDSARSAGAGEWQVFRWITLPLVRRAAVSAYILAFARGLGEFGATWMVAGNIPGVTQTLPTAIYVAVSNGDSRLAWAWTGMIVLFSWLLLAASGTGRGPSKRD